MRTLVFLLVLANLLFFAWTRGALGLGEADAPRPGEPLRADQIRLVSNDRPPEAGRARAMQSSTNSERKGAGICSAYRRSMTLLPRTLMSTKWRSCAAKA